MTRDSLPATAPTGDDPAGAATTRTRGDLVDADGAGSPTTAPPPGRPRRRDRAPRDPAAPRQRIPVFLFLPAVIGLLFLTLPLLGLLIRTPWSRLSQEFAGADVTAALRLSLVSAGLATAASLVFGVPLAWLLARVRFPGRRLVRALVMLPLVMPPVVGGVALLLALGRAGVIGQYIEHWFGYSLPFTTAGVVVAEAFVAMPYLVISVEGALRTADVRYEEAAATLGASRLTVLRRVTLPLIAPGLAAGTVLCWARALGEFGATITFAGDFPGRTETMPLAVYLAMENDPQAAIVLSLVLIAVSLIVLVSLRERWAVGP